MKKVNVTNAAIILASSGAVVSTAMAIGLDYPSMLVACAFTGAALSNAGVNIIEQEKEDEQRTSQNRRH